MKALIMLALTCAAGANTQLPARAAPLPVVEVRSAETAPVSIGSTETFTGTVRISTPFQALPPGHAGGASVSFEVQARTAWHSHPLGQTPGLVWCSKTASLHRSFGPAMSLPFLQMCAIGMAQDLAER